MASNIDINQQVISQIQQRLESAVADAVTQSDIDFVTEGIITAIKLRSRRGEYLTAASGGGTYKPAGYTKGHERARRKLGLPVDRVTLFMGQVGVLESIKGTGRQTAGGTAIEVGYLSGISEARAAEIGAWLDSEGAGTKGKTYKHIGLSSGEENKIVRRLERRVIDNITGRMQ